VWGLVCRRRRLRPASRAARLAVESYRSFAVRVNSTLFRSSRQQLRPATLQPVAPCSLRLRFTANRTTHPAEAGHPLFCAVNPAYQSLDGEVNIQFRPVKATSAPHKLEIPGLPSTRILQSLQLFTR